MTAGQDEWHYSGFIYPGGGHVRKPAALWQYLPRTGFVVAAIVGLFAGPALAPGEGHTAAPPQPQSKVSRQQPEPRRNILMDTGLGYERFQRNNSDYMTICMWTDLDRMSGRREGSPGNEKTGYWILKQPQRYLEEATEVRRLGALLDRAIDSGDAARVDDAVAKYKKMLSSINLGHSSAQNQIGNQDYSLRYFFDYTSDRLQDIMRLEYLASLANVTLAKGLMRARERGLVQVNNNDIFMLSQTAESAVDPACHPVRWCEAAKVHQVVNTQESKAGREARRETIASFCGNKG